ncbi:MAG: hypothetical protein GEU96_06570 [Propionibacteriales bacterium]|nr:hypothetical protein [Propionibacteriales bacterium]
MRYVASVAALLVCCVAPGPAAAGGESATFRGSCSLTGEVRFDPGLGATALSTTTHARAAGHCSGVLTLPDGSDRRLDDVLASYRGRASGQQSCAVGTTQGWSRLEVAGATVRFELTETRLGAVAVIRLRDATGETTVAAASVSPSHDSLDQVLACARPDGLTRTPVAITTTSTP